MLSSCPKQEQHIADKDHKAIYDWIGLFSEQKINETKLMRVHKQLIKDIFQFERCHITHYSTSKKYQHHYSYQISLLLLKAATHPDVWKQLQFNHISFFPNMNW
jgi:predicted SprT family Zn-dependent metalloprotease